jgi:ubiquinone/menaquinone biosynthesis C-methylase UbiE
MTRERQDVWASGDASEPYVGRWSRLVAREVVGERVADPRISFRAADAQALPFPSPEFDAAVSGLVLNFRPVHARALGEMRRAVRIGGTVAVYVWDYAGGRPPWPSIRRQATWTKADGSRSASRGC